MTILQAWYDRAGEYPVLRIRLDGYEPLAAIDCEATRELRSRKWGAVHIGMAFEDLLPPIQRDRFTLRGFTADKEVVRLAEKFLDDCESGRFQAGKYLMGG
jgi:hypothetical protein